MPFFKYNHLLLRSKSANKSILFGWDLFGSSLNMQPEYERSQILDSSEVQIRFAFLLDPFSVISI